MKPAETTRDTQKNLAAQTINETTLKTEVCAINEIPLDRSTLASPTSELTHDKFFSSKVEISSDQLPNTISKVELPPDQLTPTLTRNRINQKILAAITIFLLGISQIPEDAKADTNCTSTLEQTFKEEKHILNKYFSKAAVLTQLISDPRKTTLQKAMKEFFIYYSITIKEQRSLLKRMQEDGHCYTLDRFYALNDDFTERAQQFNTFMESLY